MKNLKKWIAILLSLAMVLAMFAGCGQDGTQTPASDGAEPGNADAASGDIYIPVIAKGFQHQFWQNVGKGAEAAAQELGVTINFMGPTSESEIAAQLDMISAELNKNPSAICLAALDSEAVTSQLLQAQENGIPVIGFDSGVPNAPEGTIAATAATNSYEGAAMAAEKMFEAEQFAENLKKATADHPVLISVQAQDVTSSSIVARTTGFCDKMKELCETVFPGGVAITGFDKFNQECAGDMVVEINITIPPTTSTADSQSAMQAVLQKSNLIAIFGTDEGKSNAVLAATSDGQDLDRENGKYKDVIFVGFDAGSTQKQAVRNQWIYGSVAQDSFQIGYQAVDLAVKAISGETVSDIDTGCVFYTHENIDDPEIADLLYD